MPLSTVEGDIYAVEHPDIAGWGEPLRAWSDDIVPADIRRIAGITGVGERTVMRWFTRATERRNIIAIKYVGLTLDDLIEEYYANPESKVNGAFYRVAVAKCAAVGIVRQNASRDDIDEFIWRTDALANSMVDIASLYSGQCDPFLYYAWVQMKLSHPSTGIWELTVQINRRTGRRALDSP